MLPLVCGGTVVIASRAEASDPVALQAALASSPITVMQATPITWRMLLDAGWDPLPGFRVLCGGEAMPRELAQQLLAHGVELWNLYGPTETTVWSTVERIADASARLSIGRPIANTQVQILDTDGAEMPPGAVGEICIGGAGVARGYRNRPALTAERFVPGGTGSATRMYRTGDRGRWRSDGRLECFGRIDHQVKVRGFRIEPGEIEAVLAGDGAVKQAVVHVWDDGPAARLVAYLVPENDASIDVGALRERVAIALPAYMHPASYTVLERWPLTANGKVDRRRLPAPDLAERVNPHYEPPATPIEEAIASLWLELLKVRRVGALDNFFDLGGHSLLATQLASRLRTLLDVDLPLRTVFDAPTVRGLSIAATNAMLLAEDAADAAATSAFNEAR
jgi:acyl-CoA synthetase (AMP-forming)/AMP-acid ligase II